MPEKIKIRPFTLVGQPNAYLWGSKLAHDVFIGAFTWSDLLSPDQSGNIVGSVAKAVIGSSLMYENHCTHNDGSINRIQYAFDNGVAYLIRAGITATAIDMLTMVDLSNLSTGEGILLGAAALSVIKTLAGIAFDKKKAPARATRRIPKPVKPDIKTIENKIQEGKKIKQEQMKEAHFHSLRQNIIPTAPRQNQYSDEDINYIDPDTAWEIEDSINQTKNAIEIANRKREKIYQMAREQDSIFMVFINTVYRMMTSKEPIGVDKLDEVIDFFRIR